MKFKRLFAFLLALAFIVAFASCRPTIRPNENEFAPSDEVILPTAFVTAPATEAPETDEPTAAPTAVVTAPPTAAPTPAPTEVPFTECPVSEDGVYDSKDEVALYIHLFGHLPDNYITKKQAQSLGWTGGSLEPYAPGKCIGGDHFGNYEQQLPTKKGRTYTECDIGTLGKSSRGAKRIVFSNDGLIYYTGDHYEHFTLLYGGD